MQILALFVGGFLCLVVFFCVEFNSIYEIIYLMRTKPAIYLLCHILLKICMSLCRVPDKTVLTYSKKKISLSIGVSCLSVLRNDVPHLICDVLCWYR